WLDDRNVQQVPLSATMWGAQSDLLVDVGFVLFFFSSRRRHTISKRDWSSDVCSSDLKVQAKMFRVKVYRETFYLYLKVAWSKLNMVLLILNICYSLVQGLSMSQNQVI